MRMSGRFVPRPMVMTGLGIMKPWKKAPSVPNSTGVPPKKRKAAIGINRYLILRNFIGNPLTLGTVLC